jgi:hypothetical protein
LKVETTTLFKAQVFIPSHYAMHNLVFYCLGLELHDFYDEALWIRTHCRLDKVVILTLKNGERIFFEILWGLGVIWSWGVDVTRLQRATT